MTLTLRYMLTPDIPTVVVIDRMSFEPAWSARSYAHEINESNYSHMCVLEQTREVKPNGFRRLLRASAPSMETEIVGYGGLWNIADEAHISTIATHPQYRGRGWGELMLAGMIRKALVLRTSYVVLEVRVSNVIAQNLYHKYGFKIVDTKAHYYSNNGEDAYDMRLYLTGEGSETMIAQFNARFTSLVQRVGLIDAYTEAQPTRPSQS